MATTQAASNIWTYALDQWSTYLSTVEDLVLADSCATIPQWNPPPNTGAMPAEQLGRAQTLLARQQALVARLELAALSVLQERSLTVAVSDSSAQLTPRFIDTRS
jgi:hypothetical protein